jgi:hypothetical protein
MITNKGLLFIEPTQPASKEPVIDGLTRRMTAALNGSVGGTNDGWQGAFRPGGGWRGVHTCVCGVNSSNRNFQLEDGTITNSLCIHYLAHHRDEIPKSELDKVRSLPSYEAEPSQSQLMPSGFGRRTKIRPR